MAGATSGAVTVYPSEAHEFNPVFKLASVAQSLVLCVVFCISLYFLFLLGIALSLLLITLLVSSNSSEEYIKRLLDGNFHITPDINPRLPY